MDFFFFFLKKVCHLVKTECHFVHILGISFYKTLRDISVFYPNEYYRYERERQRERTTSE